MAKKSPKAKPTDVKVNLVVDGQKVAGVAARVPARLSVGRRGGYVAKPSRGVEK